MKDIPANGIYYDDALIIVFQMLTPDWQIVEERLNPSSPYYDKFPERDAKEGANREAHRAYDKAQRLAHEWLQERIGRGILVALIRDPNTGEILQLDRHKNIFQYGPKSGGQPVFFDRKSFDNVVKEIAQPTTVISNPPVIDKAGRPPEHDWNAIKAFALEQIAVLAKPARDNKRLTTKAQLI